MPDGVTSKNVCKVLQETISVEQLTKARESKEPIFSYSVLGRKADRPPMFKVFETLKGLLTMAGTTIIDKKILEEAFARFDAKAGGVMAASSATPEIQAYSLKCMLSNINQTKRASVTGTRLAPWLKELTDLAPEGENADTEVRPGDGASLSPTSSKAAASEAPSPSPMKGCTSPAPSPSAAKAPANAPRHFI